MADQGHDSFYSSTKLKNFDNETPIAFDQATPSKKMTPTTKSPSSIIEKESYKDKKCDQLATNHLKQELLHKIKHYMSCLQQDNKTDYMDEYIKAMQDQIASLKSEAKFVRGEVKEKTHSLNNLIITITTLIEVITAIMIMMIIIFFIKLVTVLQISLTTKNLVIILMAWIMIKMIIIIAIATLLLEIIIA